MSDWMSAQKEGWAARSTGATALVVVPEGGALSEGGAASDDGEVPGGAPHPASATAAAIAAATAAAAGWGRWFMGPLSPLRDPRDDHPLAATPRSAFRYASPSRSSSAFASASIVWRSGFAVNQAS